MKSGRQGVAVRHPGLAPGRIGRLGEIRPAQDLDQLTELPIVARRDDDMPVRDWKDVIGHDIGMGHCRAGAPPAPRPGS